MTSVGVAEQMAGKGAARAVKRRRTKLEGAQGATWAHYTLLTIVLLIFAYPLYFAFLLSTSTAGVVLATIPLVILFAFAGRQLVSGIMAGAVKG